MKNINAEVVSRLAAKAAQSTCRYKVAAVGLDSRGNVLGIFSNRPRFVSWRGSDNYYGRNGDWHAEHLCLRRCGPELSLIYVTRVKNGRLLRMDPCKACVDACFRNGVECRPLITG